MKISKAKATKKIVTLTENAVREAKRRLEAEQQKEANQALGLRLGVKGGGCSGFSYLIKISAAQPEDFVDESYGMPIFIDKKSSLYLKGVTLDYTGGFMGSGFKFENPNSTNTCGCGESFSV